MERSRTRQRDEVIQLVWMLVKKKYTYIEAGEDQVADRHAVAAAIWRIDTSGTRWFPEVHPGPCGTDRWIHNGGATPYVSVILFTDPIIGALILVNYTPIWKSWIRRGVKETYVEAYGWGWRLDKHWRMILEHVQWDERALIADLYRIDLQHFDIGRQIGHIPHWSWIYDWWRYWIMWNILDRGH